MRPDCTQRCVPDKDYQTPQQHFDEALAKKEAELAAKDKAIAELAVALDYVLAEAQETLGKKVMLLESVKVEVYNTMLKLVAKHKGE